MRHVTASVVIALLAMTLGAAQYDPALKYQRRGDRDEGLRSEEIGGGLQVELLSARIEGGPSTARSSKTARSTWSESVKVRFYLPDPADAYLIVRQLRTQSNYYWLTFPARGADSLAGKWTPAATNEYAWPTSSVLVKLPEVRLEDLGVVVRVGQQGATNLQHVLPAALFDREPIDVVDAYRFSIRPLSKVMVAAAILQEGRELDRRPPTLQDADSPFTVRWRPSGAREGWYKLALSVFSPGGSNPDRLDQEIRFYHRPSLRGVVRSNPR